MQFNAKKRICLDEALRHKYLSAINKLNPSHQHISPIMGLENMNNIDRYDVCGENIHVIFWHWMVTDAFVPELDLDLFTLSYRFFICISIHRSVIKQRIYDLITLTWKEWKNREKPEGVK